MLTEKQIDNFIEQNYDNILKHISKKLYKVFYKNNYYIKNNDKYIYVGKLIDGNFIYLKDIYPYYNELIIGDINIYKTFKHFINTNIVARVINNIKDIKLVKEDKHIIYNKFLNKIGEEKIDELMILYKLKGEKNE